MRQEAAVPVSRWLQLVLLGAVVVLIAGIAGTLWVVLFASPTVSPVQDSTPATPPATAPPTATPADPPATAVVTSTLTIGANAEVGGTGQCLNVRQNPTLSGGAVDCLADGTKLRILAGPVVADGVTWWQVTRVSVPSEGWVSGQYLRFVPP